MNGEDLLTVNQVTQHFPAFSEKTLRWWIFNAERNSFDTCLIRIGSRIYIERDKFIAWLEEHRVIGESVTNPKREDKTPTGDKQNNT